MQEPGAQDALDAETVWGRDPAAVDSSSLPTGANGKGGLEYRAILEAFRILQDRFSGSAVSPEGMATLTARLTALAEDLAPYQAAEHDRYDGQRPDLPGRGSALIPPYVIEELHGNSLRGRVTFGRFHLGGNGAAHGGVVSMLFDDVLGKIANYQQVKVARTVGLEVRYRRIAPIGVELRLDARLESIDGRKRSTAATLTDAAGQLVAEGRGLFVELLPGQA
jgi:acyl-coenzyme A thioesterase PaaI-like protein